MKNPNEISNLMVEHHALIEALLVVFKDSLGKDIKYTENSFDEFMWEFEKHIFIEEKAIFKFCASLESEICKITQNLVKEHDKMLEMLNEVKNDLVTKNQADISKFQELLVSHREIEEKDLYPDLDQMLDKAQKEMIVARINEIPFKKGAEI